MRLHLLSLLPALAAAWLPPHGHLTSRTSSPPPRCPPRNPLTRHPLPTCPPNPTVLWRPDTPIRGTNLGGLFILEPWMAHLSWASMGCGDAPSEFDCVMTLGQERADAVFQHHWALWITRDDLYEMVGYGLNTIRVPVGYWMHEEIVWRDSEYFPRGGLGYLKRLLEWAAELGLYVILDLHGSPGAQVERNAFTGQFAPHPGFYVPWQFERGYKFLEWATELIHTDPAFRSVGALQIINEPVRLWEHPEMCAALTGIFHPTAWRRIRDTEARLRIPAEDRVHIVMMNARWGSGDPKAFLPDQWHAMYDDHRYIKWTDTAPTREAYLRASCADDRGGEWPTVVGEWSISVATEYEWAEEFAPWREEVRRWYRRWWAAQVLAYERVAGWTFWSWKTELGDWRWGYAEAVREGVVPRDVEEAYWMGACEGV